VGGKGPKAQTRNLVYCEPKIDLRKARGKTKKRRAVKTLGSKKNPQDKEDDPEASPLEKKRRERTSGGKRGPKDESDLFEWEITQ